MPLPLLVEEWVEVVEESSESVWPWLLFIACCIMFARARLRTIRARQRALEPEEDGQQMLLGEDEGADDGDDGPPTRAIDSRPNGKPKRDSPTEFA